MPIRCGWWCQCGWQGGDLSHQTCVTLSHLHHGKPPPYISLGGRTELNMIDYTHESLPNYINCSWQGRFVTNRNDAVCPSRRRCTQNWENNQNVRKLFNRWMGGDRENVLWNPFNRCHFKTEHDQLLIDSVTVSLFVFLYLMWQSGTIVDEQACLTTDHIWYKMWVIWSQVPLGRERDGLSEAPSVVSRPSFGQLNTTGCKRGTIFRPSWIYRLYIVQGAQFKEWASSRHI